MATFSHISGAEPSTVTFKAATVTQTRNSSAMHQEIIALGDPDTSNAIAAVLSGVPASTAWGLVTREAGGFLSSVGGIVQIQGNSTVLLSLGTLQSSVAPAGNSSGLIVRIAGGPSSAADLVMRPVFSSTSTDNPVSAVQSGAWSVSIGTNLQSSVSPSSNSSGLIVRPVICTPLTFCSTNAFASTLAAINSTATGQRCKVFAYSITTTNAGPTKVSFYGGSSLKWAVVLAAVSSAVSGVNLAVSPPACLFQCAQGSSMTIRTGGSTIAGWKVAVGYFMDP